MSGLIVNLSQGTSEWLDWRFSGFGGSDSPATLDESPYKTRRELVKEKITRTVTEDPSKEFIFAKGHRTEGRIRELFQDLIGEDATPVCMQHSKYPELIASLDGRTKKHGVLEAKLVGAEVLKTANETGEIPRYHWIQIQHNCNVSGDELGQWFGHDGKKNGVLIPIPADKKFIKMLEEEELALWQKVLAGELPELGPKDYLIPDDWSLLTELRELRELCDNAEIEFDRVKKQVINQFNHPKIAGGGLKVFQTEKRGSIDLKDVPEIQAALKKLTPEYLETFRKPSSKSWTVKIDKPEGGKK